FCDSVGLRFPERFYDTQLVGLLILHALKFYLPGGAYNHARLGDLTTRYGIPFPWGDRKDVIRDSIMRGTFLSDYGMEIVLAYCRDDARACVDLLHPLLADLGRLGGPNAENNLRELYQPYALHMARAARSGFRFDIAAWDHLLELAPRYRRRLLAVMNKYGYD